MRERRRSDSLAVAVHADVATFAGAPAPTDAPGRSDAAVAFEAATFVRSVSARSAQDRLERILLDDQELLISLRCQLEQIHRELRLLNDDRIVRALVDPDSSFRH